MSVFVAMSHVIDRDNITSQSLGLRKSAINIVEFVLLIQIYN